MLAQKQEYAQKEGTILPVANVDAWIAKVTTLIVDNKVSGGYRQKLLFVEIWQPGELNTVVEHGTIKQRKCTMVQGNLKNSYITNIPFSYCTFIAVKSTGSKHLSLTTHSGHGWYIVEISKTFKKFILIGSEVSLIEY